MTARFLLTGAAALALAACAGSPAPSPTPDMVQLPDRFALAPAAADAEVAEAQLQALLPEDPAFDALAARTLAEGPDLLAAIARIEAARAGAARARAERLPSVGYDAGVSATRTNPDQFGASLPPGVEIDTERTSYAANLTARWDADLFGQLKASERAAGFRLDAATAQAAAVRLALVGEIGSAVIDWRTLDAQAKALAADASSARELERLALVREEAGLAPGIDSERAAAQAAASEARLAALESQRALLLGRLIALTALPAPEVIAAFGAGSLDADLPEAPAALPSTLLVARPDVAASAAQLAAADAEVLAAAAARFPKLSLSAGIGLLAFAIGDLFDADSIVGSLAAGIAGPLLDFGRIDAEIDRAEAETQIAFQQYRGTVFTALGETESAYLLIEAADREADAAARQAASASRAARLTRMRLDAGLANLSQALEAQRLADAGNAEAAAALGRAQRARLLLWQALGGSALD
ncbi:efflux transporter outer membrane subunit [Sphingomicrobium clamense]|uniref:Efflux transporter outer membrane subunit n=1 Tax=Sphingomicrobium clamense TaxID=2851013 RepID=A0ABS6V385_9SPHN|nr:efflux transporter outer membrane subunit [Sphingomicrobium sp. B8]MBW0143692.1 efflux transporter outer membrane subunit [Sphingomicrobium sp. B8]